MPGSAEPNGIIEEQAIMPVLEQMLALSGPRNPYLGRLGVVEQDALADLLLVDGNPVENIALQQALPFQVADHTVGSTLR